MTNEVNQKPIVYFENLDALRFLSFLAVFFFHSFHTNYVFIKNSSIYRVVKKDLFGNGNLGVNFFFVLSGFLITYLLLKEIDFTGKVNVVAFWKRRIFRIWPLFFFCVFFGFIIFPTLKAAFGQTPNETATPIFYLFFLNNFDFINKGVPDASVLGVLWSVAIEEQFYLVWPLLLSLPRKFHSYLFCLIILSSVVFRYLNDNPLQVEYHTLSCMGDLAVGAFGAWLVLYQKIDEKIRMMTKMQVAFIYIIVMFLFFFRNDFGVMLGRFNSLERLFVAVIFLLVILEQNYAKNSLFKLKNFTLLTSLGVISYGLYCLHFIGILIATTSTSIFKINTQIWQVLILETGLAFFLTIMIAFLSYNIFELPFLKIGKKYSLIVHKR
jgi:peptidoglycan/LPS O-acetylase OafA/YrhL